MKRTNYLVILIVLFAVVPIAKPDSNLEQNWAHFVRIGAYGLQSDNADKLVRNAQESNVFGIEVDNDVTGRYESFLNPEAKLRAIRTLAQKAHQAGNRAFVYIAGTECITANADKTPHTLAKEHPDWLQKNIKGDPAVFGGGAASGSSSSSPFDLGQSLRIRVAEDLYGAGATDCGHRH